MTQTIGGAVLAGLVLLAAGRTFAGVVTLGLAVAVLSAGGCIGWIMKTSRPRAFSSMRTKISPSANRFSVTSASFSPMAAAISDANGSLAVPASRSMEGLLESLMSCARPLLKPLWSLEN